MSSDDAKSPQKWLINFKFEKEYENILIDLKDTSLFDKKYPVFKMLFARELLESKAPHFFHVKRTEYVSEIRDPTGNDLPMDSCIFILGISNEVGFLKILFIPQPEERLVLVGLDEVWVKVLETVEKSQRLTLITNVVASLVMNQDAWNQVYLLY